MTIYVKFGGIQLRLWLDCAESVLYVPMVRDSPAPKKLQVKQIKGRRDFPCLMDRELEYGASLGVDENSWDLA